MRAETLVGTHTNTDFDAFAAMLAARRLFPGSVVCLAGSLNRNVREFYRLHADELDFVVDASRLELDTVRRLIVVETVHASRLGELEPVALDSGVDKVVFDHHAAERPEWAPPENVIVSEDGALTTTLVGVLAEREVAVSPLEATVFALGIHEDTGSLTHATRRNATPRRSAGASATAPSRSSSHGSCTPRSARPNASCCRRCSTRSRRMRRPASRCSWRPRPRGSTSRGSRTWRTSSST